MYALEITCLNCKDKYIFEREELWRIIMLSNELELRVYEKKLACRPCQQIGPMKLVVKDLAQSVVVFEKIISAIIGNSTHTHHKPSMDNPCLMCTAKGYIEVQYKAHKKEASFKGILNETCPICNGKGYSN